MKGSDKEHITTRLEVIESALRKVEADLGQGCLTQYEQVAHSNVINMVRSELDALEKLVESQSVTDEVAS